MAIPQMGANGLRDTVNNNITDAQRLWNLRSGLNVAALNCLRAEHATLVDNYKTMLNAHKRELASTNTALQKEYRNRYGASYRDQQDSYMTQVYNYFALPPALSDFCDVSLQVSNEVTQVPAGQLGAYAQTALPRMEAVFENFFRAYEQYRVNLAAWTEAYGPKTVTTVRTYGAVGDPATTMLEGTYSAPETAVTYTPVASTAAQGQSDLTAPVDMGAQPQIQFVSGTGETAGNDEVTQPSQPSGPAPQFVSQPVVQTDEKDEANSGN